MPDLIDREKVLKYLDDYLASGLFGEGVRIGYEMARGFVECFEPADTEQHAHWTRINDVLSQCSNCKTTILRCDTDNYCSNCGCKMDEVVGNE